MLSKGHQQMLMMLALWGSKTQQQVLKSVGTGTEHVGQSTI